MWLLYIVSTCQLALHHMHSSLSHKTKISDRKLLPSLSGPHFDSIRVYKKTRRNGEGGGGTTTRGTTVAKLKFRGLCQSCSGGCQVASQREASQPTTTTAKAAYWGGVPPPKNPFNMSMNHPSVQAFIGNLIYVHALSCQLPYVQASLCSAGLGACLQ